MVVPCLQKIENDKTMFIQLQKNPMICICACAKDYSWIRIHTRLYLAMIDIKAKYLERSISSFKDINDLHFSIFYLSDCVNMHKKGDTEYYVFS